MIFTYLILGQEDKSMCDRNYCLFKTSDVFREKVQCDQHVQFCI